MTNLIARALIRQVCEQPPAPADPRDATIRELRAEVERLANLLEDQAEDYKRDAREARAFLARLEARHA